MLTHLARFRFSLTTLLLVVTWSAAVLWMNTSPNEHWWPPNLIYCLTGYPWVYAKYATTSGHGLAEAGDVSWNFTGLAGDCAVGLLLVTALTWGSKQVLLFRFRFSLATLLLLAAWSGVALWMNVMPRVSSYEVAAGTFFFGVKANDAFERHVARWGWPCCYVGDSSSERASLSRLPPRGQIDYRALFLDIAVGVLLIGALTWGSSQVLRRVGVRLRRRSALLLGKGESLDSHANKAAPTRTPSAG